MNNKRLKRKYIILFENLPDDIFDEIFSYLNGVDASYAFSQLNYRFKCLVIKYCRMFDFQSTEKIKLNFALQHCCTKQWKSLRLSDDDETPGQIEYFSQICHTKIFPQLESLCILGMNTDHTSRLLWHLPFLTNLVSLTMKSVCGRTILSFDLPQLKKLVVRSCKHTDWLKKFSQLENLEYTFTSCCSNGTFLKWPTTLKCLRIVSEIRVDPRKIHGSISKLVLLNTLEIYQKERERILPDGQVWEQEMACSL